MATNVQVISGATEVNIFRRNYPYFTAITEQPILTFNIFSDLQVLGFKDSLDNLKKVLVDASGSTAATAEEVFFANSDGEATTSSNLTFDGTELYIQGEQVAHGTISADSVTLTNNGHTAIIALDATGVLTITIDGIEQVNYSNGGPD